MGASEYDPAFLSAVKRLLADEGADYANDHVIDRPEPGPLHDVTGQPPGCEANQQYDKETFIRQVHDDFLIRDSKDNA